MWKYSFGTPFGSFKGLRRFITAWPQLTIASMAGAIAGAFSGLEAIRSDWVEKALRVSARDQEALARDLVGTAPAKMGAGAGGDGGVAGACGVAVRPSDV